MSKVAFGLEAINSHYHYWIFKINYFHFCALQIELDGDKL